MRHKHQTKRTFPTKCRECGKPILYWECAICRARTFFDLPIYGKPIRHICEKYKTGLVSYHVPKWRQAKELDEAQSTKLEIYNCPVCNKTFKHENALNEHIKQLKKNDEDHIIFFTQVLDLIDFDDDEDDKEEGDENDTRQEEKDDGTFADYKKDTFVKMDSTYGRVHMRKKHNKKGKKTK